MKINLLHKKWFRAILIILVIVTVLSSGLTITFRFLLEKYNISYSNLSFRFPAALQITDLSLHRNESLRVDVGLVEAEWKWIPLIRKNPDITHLLIENAEISVVNSGNKTMNSEGFSLPSFSLKDISLRKVHLDMTMGNDSLQVVIPEMILNAASYKEKLEIDSLILYRPGLSYSMHSSDIGKPEKVGQPFMLESVPMTRVNHVTISHAEARFSSDSAKHVLNDLNLTFSGWNKQELAGFSIDRLGLNYQDTLDLQIVLEDGTVNNHLYSELNNIELEIPGARIDLEKAGIDLRKEISAGITLNRSYLTVGWIRQLSPSVARIFNPALPGSTRIFFQGQIQVDTGKAIADQVLLTILDSTFITISGDVNLVQPELQLSVNPLRSTRNDLVRLLAPEDYQKFYNWPVDINGWTDITGKPDSLRIIGNLNSRQGRLAVRSTVLSDSTAENTFLLELEGDSLLLDQVSPLVPPEVPLGHVNFLLQQESERSTGSNNLLIRISSNWLDAFEHRIKDVEFKYISTNRSDRMEATVNDDMIALNATMNMPSDENPSSEILLELNHLLPHLWSPDLPEGALSANISGTMINNQPGTAAEVKIRDAIFQGAGEGIIIPDASIDLKNEAESMALRLHSGDSLVLAATVSGPFPEFSLPVTGWIDSIPEMAVDFNINLGEEVFRIFTGQSGSLALSDFTMRKENEYLTGSALIREFQFGSVTLDPVSMQIEGDRNSLEAGLFIEEMQTSSATLDSLHISLGADNEGYSFSLRNNKNNFFSDNYLSMKLDQSGQGYRLYFAKNEPVLINGANFTLENNDGIHFDERMRLSGGNLGIRHEHTILGVSTENEHVSFTVDSLELLSWVTTIEQGAIEKVIVNAGASFNTGTLEAGLQGEVTTYHHQVDHPLKVYLEGSIQSGDASAHLKVVQEGIINATADIGKKEDDIIFLAGLDYIKADALHYIPGWPDDLSMEGVLKGYLDGTLQPELNTNGYIVANDVSITHPYTSEPVFIEYDSILLKDGAILFSNFRVADVDSSYLFINGEIDYSPEIAYSLNVLSDNFSVLNALENSSTIRGNLESDMDIMVEGDPGNTRVSGTIKTVPGGNVQYTSQKNFKKVDASDIVTFMDLDAEKDDSYLYQQSSDFALDLNVGIGIEETRVEILLNEIDQEYIEILGSGNLSLRTGLDDQPLIYGEITSGSGRAFIKPSPLPDMDLVIEDATVRWSGRIDEPVVSFRGYKTVRGPARGFSSEFSERNDLVDYRIIVVLDQATLSEFDLEFDLSAEDSQIQTYLASQPSETREFYAINLLVFGRVGAEKLQGNSMLANQVTRKLNELARRNLKNTGIQFSSETYKIGSDGLTDRSRTDLNYAISRGFLNNRLNIKVGGSVGINSDDMTEVPPSDLIGNLEIDYIISRDPSIILKGTRKDVYEGIIDGIVTEESIGISFQKSYPTIKEMFRKEQEEAE